MIEKLLQSATAPIADAEQRRLVASYRERKEAKARLEALMIRAGLPPDVIADVVAESEEEG